MTSVRNIAKWLSLGVLWSLLAYSPAGRAVEPSMPAQNQTRPASAGDEVEPEPEEGFWDSVEDYLEALAAPVPDFEFLERHYIAYRALPQRLLTESQGGTLQLFEADLTPHFFMYNSLPSMARHKLEAWEGGKTRATWATALSFTMRVRLRMLGETSAPVRTPSFMPRLNAQILNLRKRPLAVGDEFRLNGFRLSLGHHSNGQEGCPFEAGQLEDTGCTDTGSIADPRLVNRVNGSFSINHLTFAVHTKWGSAWKPPVANGASRLQDKNSQTLGVSAMIYPVGFLKYGTNSREQADLYGTWNLRAEYAMERTVPPIWFFKGSYPGLIRLALRYTHFLGSSLGDENQIWEPSSDDSTVAAYRLTATLSYSSVKAGGLGLFTRVDRGRDYYNMLFTDTVTQWLVGIADRLVRASQAEAGSGRRGFGGAVRP